MDWKRIRVCYRWPLKAVQLNGGNPEGVPEKHGTLARLAQSALPDNTPCLFESGKLLMLRRELFVEKGPTGQDAIREIDKRLNELAKCLESSEPFV